MKINHEHIIIIAGEASGDMHAAHLVNELRKKNPHIEFSGLGGPAMQAAGVRLYEDLTKIAVVGFWEVLKHYGEFKRIFDRTLRTISETRPHAVILVDYPGFNLRLARAVKKLPSPPKVIYYISPQVWAWKENRVHIIRQSVDQMLCLFAFEKEFYARHGMAVDVVGHPLIDTAKITRSKEETLKKIGLDSGPLTIGLLPGSRKKEIEKILPVMVQAAILLKKTIPDVRFLCLQAPTIDSDFMARFLPSECPATTVSGDFYNTLHACDLCMVASGTATLETALLEKPMVIIYKTSFLTWLIAKSVVKLPCIGLANVVAGKKIVPELVQYNATPQRIAETFQEMLRDKTKLEKIRTDFIEMRKTLGGPGAAQRAADRILEILGD